MDRYCESCGRENYFERIKVEVPCLVEERELSDVEEGEGIKVNVSALVCTRCGFAIFASNAKYEH